MLNILKQIGESALYGIFCILKKTGILRVPLAPVPGLTSPVETGKAPKPQDDNFFPMEEDRQALQWAKSFGTDYKGARAACQEPERLVYLAAGRGADVKEVIAAVREYIDYAVHNPSLPEHPGGNGQMFSFIAGGNTHLLAVADEAIRGGSSVKKCLQAAHTAHNEAESIFPGACRCENEAYEAGMVRTMICAMKYLLIALAQHKKAPETVFPEKESVCDAFRISLLHPDREEQGKGSDIMCLALARAVRDAGIVAFSHGGSPRAVKLMKEILDRHVSMVPE